jgi:hypothetical protein
MHQRKQAHWEIRTRVWGPYRLDLAQSEIIAAAFDIALPVGLPSILSAQALVLDTVESGTEAVAVANEIVVLHHGGGVGIHKLHSRVLGKNGEQ